jgi:hypothetical protein
MAIKGLAEPALLDRDARGKAIRIGRLNKGERTGWGRDAKFKDFDYLAFTAYASDEKTAAQIEEVFHTVYGAEPVMFPDVRIPVDIAANFKPEDHAWLYAKKHAQDKPSVFMARSDGEHIKQLRDPKNPRKVNFHYNGEESYDKWTVADGSEYGALLWNGKQYQWQRQFSLDVILTDFNRELYRQGICGYGVVTLQTSSKWDISNLLAEYRGILDAITSLFYNPMAAGNYNITRNYLPLQDIPLQVYRSLDTLTTPSYATKSNPNPAPDARYKAQKWLLHWRIAPSFAAAMQEAMDKKQANILAAVANAPLLKAYTAEDANRDFFPDSTAPVKAIAATTQNAQYEDELEDGEWIEDSEPEQRLEKETLATNGNGDQSGNGRDTYEPLDTYTDDERAVFNATANFMPTAARLTGATTPEIKEALKQIGFTSVSGKPDERVKMLRLFMEYRRLVKDGTDTREAVKAAWAAVGVAQEA